MSFQPKPDMFAGMRQDFGASRYTVVWSMYNDADEEVITGVAYVDIDVGGYSNPPRSKRSWHLLTVQADTRLRQLPIKQVRNVEIKAILAGWQQTLPLPWET